MPRRLITSEIFRNEKFGNLDDVARLFFIGCFSNADDEGRLKGSPKYLKALIFPYDNDKTPDLIAQCRDLCHKLGLLHIYNQNGSEFIYCIGWEEHQVIRKDRRRPSALPPPNTLMSTTCQPDDNQAATNCQASDTPNLIKSNLIQSNIIDNGKELKKFPADHIEKRKRIFGLLKERRGYTSRNPAAEAKAISQMLSENITIEQILKAYDIIKAKPFFEDKNLSMMQVRKDIHEVLKNGAGQGDDKKPRDYTGGKYGHLTQH